MKLSEPLEPIYYFELTFRYRRLWYFLPFPMLEKKVATNQADAAILEDFPLGLELEVSEKDCKFAKDEYHLSAPFSSDTFILTLLAFDGIYHHLIRHDPEFMMPIVCSGVVNAEYLESLVGNIANSPEILSLVGFKQEKVGRFPVENINSDFDAQRKLWSLMAEASPISEDLKHQVDKRAWRKVKMSPGMDAKLSFAALQNFQFEVRNGNNRDR